MLVEVTESDIACGDAKDCERCPVALAILRAADAVKANVDDERIGWRGDDGIWHETKTPDVVADFFGAFDEGKPVSPFAFEADWDYGD